jgi:hypothetical protein
MKPRFKRVTDVCILHADLIGVLSAYILVKNVWNGVHASSCLVIRFSQSELPSRDCIPHRGGAPGREMWLCHLHLN